jgi:hypothetical protein
MESLIPVIVLLILLVIVALVFIGFWTALTWLFSGSTGNKTRAGPPSILETSPAHRPCQNCGNALLIRTQFCGVCGAHRLNMAQENVIRELEITLRQLERLYQTGALDEVNFRVLKTTVEAEREQLLFPNGRPGAAKQPTPPLSQPQVSSPASKPEPDSVYVKGPYITTAPLDQQAPVESIPQPGAWSKDSDKAKPFTPVLKPPRKPFAEVLASFMEQSNVRWGEIIGGILIIGCSTALVISLWAQISRVPVLKFLIFTTVTAALFGVGFYTEHHWKLPTTSRGILTIATLLVPLNFLAIAAVSSGAPSGALIVGSELVAPAVFLCLVFLAGRVITPKWPHLLAAGALGSSVGQLLVRHFAAPDNTAILLIALGAFPVLCYAVSTGWSLKLALADEEIDEGEANAIFVTLGALTFAAVLPFGLLLYKFGSVPMAMLHLAPLVTLGGAPMLATGLLLWKLVQRKELTVTRTAGGSIAILGMLVVLTGMVLAWPNPASIIPAALFNFALFTAIAVLFKEPQAHLIGAACVTFAYAIAFHVLAGHVPWENLRVTSLLPVTADVSTGQALTIPFISFTLVYEWLSRRRKPGDAASYLWASCAVAVASLLVFIAFGGIGVKGDPHFVSAIVALYTAGAFWFAWREKGVAFSWAAATLLFFTSAQVCHALLSVRFPWLASCLLFAGAGTVGALIAKRIGTSEAERILVTPLRWSGMLGSFAASALLLGLLIWRGGEPAPLFATHTLLLAVVWLGLLVLSHDPQFLTAFQMALALGAILVTKSYLQSFEWYAFWSNSWLHPWALQIQGSVLGVFCLMWLAVRAFARKRAAGPAEQEQNWILRLLLDMPVAFDHLLAGALVIGFVLLTAFGTASGISKELTSPEQSPLVFDLGFPHQLIFGASGLILLIILLAVMFGNQRERGSYAFALGTLVMLWSVCPLLAGRFESQVASASAARWSVALFLLVISIVHAVGRKSMFTKSRRDFDTTRAMVVLLTLAPLLFLTLSPVIDAVNYVPVLGPQSGIFRAMGGAALYGVPLVLAAAALAIHAVRQRSAVFAFSAGLLINLTVTVVLVVSVAARGGTMNGVVLVTALQVNAIAAACVALAWMALRTWWTKTAEAPAGSERILLACQKLMAVGFLALFIVPIGLHLIAFPNRAGYATFVAGSLTGWLALVLTIGSVIAFDKVFRRTISVALFAASLLAVASLAAFGIAELGVSRWAGLHVLLGSLVVIAWLLLLARDLPKLFSDQEDDGSQSALGLTLSDDWQRDCIRFASIVGASAVLVALRGPFSDPMGGWWSIGTLLAMCALAASLNWVTLKRGYLYAAGILVNLAASIWLIKYQSHEFPSIHAFVEANIVVLCLAGVLWLCLELRARRARAATAPQSTAASFHNVAAMLSLMAMAGVVAVRLHDDFTGLNQTLFPLLDWVALGSLGLLMTACLWDRDATYAVAGIYLLALLSGASALHNLSLAPRRLAWGLTMAGAVHALAASLIWRGREQILAWSGHLKIPPRMDPAATELAWLSFLNSLVVATVVCLAFWIDLEFFPWSMRAAAAMAVTAQAFTFGLMAQGPHRLKWQRAAIATFLVGAVLLGWSGLTPGVNGTWLNRGVILMTLTFAAVALVGIGLDKFFERRPDWSKAVHDCLPATTVAGIVSLGFVLGAEVYYQIEFGAVRVSLLARFAVAVTVAAAVIACIFFAVSPKHDPLSLSERRRGAYVYAAEVLMVLFFMHIRLTMPWLFRGFFQRYWPLVVLAIAYAGIAVSEVLRRRQIRVLADPIERTGVFLPLLPVIGFWIAQSQVEYSTLLFIVGGLYGLLSILRRSFFFGLAAALAGNGGLWYVLHETSEYHFFQHPQLWLIPAAISVLIAAHLNRKNFSAAQLTSIRYLCLATIYVSSTADIFINGVAQSPWLPLALAGLSIAGVFAGMIFRIRAFLLLGSSFLLLAIATMINYASVNFGWTWLWYVAGIVTGALIITTFAIFEKKRADVLRVVDELKDWKG